MKPKTVKRHRVRIKKVPPEVVMLVSSNPPVPLPEPVAVVLEAIASGHVEEIVLVDPEPTLWERFRKWWSDEPGS